MGKRAVLVEILPDAYNRTLNCGEVKQEEFGNNTFLDTAWLQLNKVLENPLISSLLSGIAIEVMKKGAGI